MQFKPITAIAVLLLIVVSLLVAGCTTSNTSTTNQTSTPSTATHDAFLEKYLAEYKNGTSKNYTIKAWEVTWVNSTTARIVWADVNKTTNNTVSRVTTVMAFPTTQAATSYFNAMNRTAYSIASTQYPSGGAYQRVAGHAPTVYKDYVWNEGDPANISVFVYHDIQQIDNLIITYTAKVLS
jgi:type IV pilus biogenesis protein CpaD/CtpE